MEGESAATTLVVAAVAKAAGKDIGDVTVKGSAPVVTVETDDGDSGAGNYFIFILMNVYNDVFFFIFFCNFL
jgi:hypothetical protein